MICNVLPKTVTSPTPDKPTAPEEKEQDASVQQIMEDLSFMTVDPENSKENAQPNAQAGAQASAQPSAQSQEKETGETEKQIPVQKPQAAKKWFFLKNKGTGKVLDIEGEDRCDIFIYENPFFSILAHQNSTAHKNAWS